MLEGKDFFDSIRRSVKISYFVASIIPLALLVYFSIEYVFPYLSAGDISRVPLNIGILLLLAVAVSVLGLVLSTKATNSSILSAQDLNAKLNSLFDITKQFRQTVYPEILLQKVMEAAMELTDSEKGSLLLYDENRGLKVKVNAGSNSENINNRFVLTGQGVVARVVESGKSVLINNVAKDERYNPELDNETGFTTRSILCVPLVHSNEIIGAIELRNKKKGEFTSQDEALLNSLADQASISIAQNRSGEKRHSDLIHITEILVGAQDYIQNKKGHARRVAGYANRIAKHMNFPDDELKKLYYAGLLHDIGMLKIDSADRMKKEKIMQHPKLGYELIKPISLWSESADIILHHHERYDGKGYTEEENADDVPLGARIISVADTFDILTSQYSSGNHLDHKTALNEIEANAGTLFDPRVVEALKSSLIESGIIS